MTKLADLPTDFYLEYYQQLPQIDEQDVRILWHCGYYDGPLDGILLYQEQVHWFQIFYALRTDEIRSRTDKNGTTWLDHFVRYLVVELSDEQAKEEAYWHKLFQEEVGTHTDYNEAGHRTIGALKSQDIWHEFYEAYKTRKPHDLSNNRVVGWFESLWASIEQDENEIKSNGYRA